MGFYGPRGAGKTTLLNRVLGYPRFLPTGASSAATAALTELVGSEDLSFHATICFVEMEDWEELVKAAKDEMVRLRESGEEQLGPEADALLDQLKALWENDDHPLVVGTVSDGFGWERQSFNDLIPPELLSILKQGFINITEPTGEGMSKCLRGRLWPKLQ